MEGKALGEASLAAQDAVCCRPRARLSPLHGGTTRSQHSSLLKSALAVVKNVSVVCFSLVSRSPVKVKRFAPKHISPIGISAESPVKSFEPTDLAENMTDSLQASR